MCRPVPSRRVACLVAASLAAAALSAGGSALGVDRAPSAAFSSASSRTRHYEYVVRDSATSVYDIDRGHKLVDTIELPQTKAVRGVMTSAATHMLYISYGGDGGAEGHGSMLKYDLVARRIVWTRSYPTGVDSGAITPNGKTIYLPTGENDLGGHWDVIDARSGAVTHEISGGAGPHNTIVSLDGKHVYLGGHDADYLAVAETRTNKVIRRIGPLKHGIRPFTINGKETLAYTTATGFLGFQVSSIVTGKVLYTVSPKGFGYDSKSFPLSTPSHGISLSPNERQLYLLDAANNYVHVYDVSRVPAAAPRRIADIKLTKPIAGKDSPCASDLCDRFGWLQHSRSGRYVYVGDSGDVIDTLTRHSVLNLEPLHNTRKMIEIDWRNGVPVFTTSRIGIGRVIRKRSR